MQIAAAKRWTGLVTPSSLEGANDGQQLSAVIADHSIAVHLGSRRSAADHAGSSAFHSVLSSHVVLYRKVRAEVFEDGVLVLFPLTSRVAKRKLHLSSRSYSVLPSLSDHWMLLYVFHDPST